MSARIIPFSVRQTPDWPDGQLGEEMERLAQHGCRAVLARGEHDTIERARRRVLQGMYEVERMLGGSK